MVWCGTLCDVRYMVINQLHVYTPHINLSRLLCFLNSVNMIRYFMYKRSEITCHGTRDYLTAKWGVSFPNTGFWTYIKYTIVEQQTYLASVLSVLPWRDQASVVFGFFQMVGFNRYERRRGEKCGGEPGEWVIGM